MRGWIALGGLALLLVVAGVATAHAPAVDVEPDAGGDDPTPACVPLCETRATRSGYASPVTVVEPGTTLTWTSADADSHTATSDVPAEHKPSAIVNGVPAYGHGPCMDVNLSEGNPGKARIDIIGGQLAVLDEDQLDDPPDQQTWNVCEEATRLPGGAWVLTYQCTTHPQLQHGTLAVVPS